MSKYGIDVSHYQGNIDWKKVRNCGKEFAILKVSQGSKIVDSRFEEYYKNATANGIKLGAYIYNKVKNVSEAEAEAKLAVKYLNGKEFPLGIWLDLEDKTMRSLGKTMLNSIISKETEILKNAGFKVNIYCNRDWYLNVLDTASLKNNYKFWIARYPSGDNGTIKEGLKTDYMDMWQYSSKGKVDGIVGNVDMNIMYNESLLGSTPVVAKNPYKEPTTTIKKGSKGEGAKWVQWELVESGYQLKIDGIIGLQSSNAIIDFQRRHGLQCDGIVGKLTREKLKE